jgi:hypothetical protein
MSLPNPAGHLFRLARALRDGNWTRASLGSDCLRGFHHFSRIANDFLRENNQWGPKEVTVHGLETTVLEKKVTVCQKICLVPVM